MYCSEVGSCRGDLGLMEELKSYHVIARAWFSAHLSRRVPEPCVHSKVPILGIASSTSTFFQVLNTTTTIIRMILLQCAAYSKFSVSHLNSCLCLPSDYHHASLVPIQSRTRMIITPTLPRALIKRCNLYHLSLLEHSHTKQFAFPTVLRLLFSEKNVLHLSHDLASIHCVALEP